MAAERTPRAQRNLWAAVLVAALIVIVAVGWVFHLQAASVASFAPWAIGALLGVALVLIYYAPAAVLRLRRGRQKEH